MNRQEVREIADLYLSRLDERLERRLAEFGATVEGRFAEFGATVGQRFAAFGATVDRRFVELDVKMERRLVELESRIESKMTAGFAAVRIEFNDRLSAQYRDLLRWFFIFSAGTIVPLTGLMIALVKL
ncbi:MAG: hypothetical protein HY337_04375 [Gemmatimonadetes bacterium]|nr:hypothetical protein [Gemmatimonadota bacterium]